jgi:DNA primase
MSYAPRYAFQPRISLLEFLSQRGWKPVRDQGREELAGLCPLHRESRPSFYVNRRKQVFYCHGCGRGGGLAQLVRLLELCGELPTPAATVHPPPEKLLEHTYRFYQWQLAHAPEARAYLAERGIQDPAVVRRMRIGYTPGACLRGFLARLGYPRQALCARGLIDLRGRDTFFRRLTFPLPEAGNLYGRSLTDGPCRHRFLPGSKGGLYGWEQPLPFPRVILVEGLFDLAALWQAGFDQTVAALGAHLNPLQLTQLGRMRPPSCSIWLPPSGSWISSAKTTPPLRTNLSACFCAGSSVSAPVSKNWFQMVRLKNRLGLAGFVNAHNGCKKARARARWRPGRPGPGGHPGWEPAPL